MPYKKTKLSTLTKGNSIFFLMENVCFLVDSWTEIPIVWNSLDMQTSRSWPILSLISQMLSKVLDYYFAVFFLNLCLLILFSFKCSKVQSCSAYILQNFRDSTWSFLSSTVQILYLRGNDVDTLIFGRSSTGQISNTHWKKEI